MSSTSTVPVIPLSGWRRSTTGWPIRWPGSMTDRSRRATFGQSSTPSSRASPSLPEVAARLASSTRGGQSLMYYVAHGSLPRQRHTQHRAPDGSLYAEELFGVEGFTGRSSILYHLVPPTQTYRIEPVRRVELVAADDGLHRHRLTKTGAVPTKGDAISGRIPLYFNNDVVFGVVRPAEPMPPGTFYRNGIADEMLYVHEGSGVCDTIFGPLRYGPGGWIRTKAQSSGSCTSRRRRRSSRPSATAMTTASSSSTRRTRSATFTHP